MIKHWITFGMSQFLTPGFQDTSRLMTYGWNDAKVYIQPPKPFAAWKHPSTEKGLSQKQ